MLFQNTAYPQRSKENPDSSIGESLIFTMTENFGSIFSTQKSRPERQLDCIGRSSFSGEGTDREILSQNPSQKSTTIYRMICGYSGCTKNKVQSEQRMLTPIADSVVRRERINYVDNSHIITILDCRNTPMKLIATKVAGLFYYLNKQKERLTMLCVFNGVTYGGCK